MRTPSNFGSQGDRPSHPELLDYLADSVCAGRLVAQEAASQNHADGRLWVERRDPRATTLPKTPTTVCFGDTTAAAWTPNRSAIPSYSSPANSICKAGGPAVRLDKENNRRTVYAYISRRQLDPMLALFDFPNPNSTSEQRLQTTVPLQKLFFMNSPFVIDQSAALSARVAADESNDDQRITATYRLSLQRDPTPEERQACASIHRRKRRRVAGVHPGPAEFQ